MLTKILFTIVITIIVFFVYRTRRQAPSTSPRNTSTNTPDNGIKRQVIAYIFAGLIVTVSAIIFLLHWKEQHRVVNIRVIDGATGEAIDYQAYKKFIDGRQFETLDGHFVTLGDADRIEMIKAYE